jgi:hypothetical protein
MRRNFRREDRRNFRREERRPAAWESRRKFTDSVCLRA